MLRRLYDTVIHSRLRDTMLRRPRSFLVLVTALGLVAAGSSPFVFAPPKDKPQEHKEHKAGKPEKAKKQKHMNGKDLVGDKIKKDGKHEFHQHGKFTASVDVSKGKIAGVKVKHAEKGDVPVTKYKTNKKMARGPAASGIQLASYVYAQEEYVGTMWIGYAYIDDYGEEVIYWFPYDMILDGDTGAIEYYPAY